MAKSTRKPFANQGEKASRPFEYIYTDLVGPFPVATPSGFKYFIGFTDKFSNYTWAYLLKKKSEATSAVIQFYQETIAQGFRVEGASIAYLSSDRGGEFFNDELSAFLKSKGIRHQSGPAYTPEFNSIQERMNRTLVEMALALLFQSKLSMECWGLAVDTSVYIRNRCPTASNPDSMTPFEMIFGFPPDISHLRVFGSRCYYHIPEQLRTKLQPKSKEAIFVGYDLLSRCYRVLPVGDRSKVVLTRDVIFDEKSIVGDIVSSKSHSLEEQQVDKILSGDSDLEMVPLIQPKQVQIPPVPPQPRRSQRVRNPPDYYGFVSSADSEVKENTLAFCYKSVVEFDDNEPSSLREALTGPESQFWAEAIASEKQSLLLHSVWEDNPIPRDPSMSVVNTKFIFKKKQEGLQATRFKARLVAQGFRQVEGIDYSETFSAVVDKASLRFALHLIASHEMKVLKFDVSTAFLYAKIDDDIYVTLPKEIFDFPSDHVFKLKKALYGLKQSPRAWQAELRKTLGSIGFSPCQKDPCVFLRFQDGKLLAVCAVHVDDGILGVVDSGLSNEICRVLMGAYKLSVTANPETYLGIDLIWHPETASVVISQKTYIQKLVKKFGIDLSRVVRIPMDPNKKLQKPSEISRPTERNYQELVGCLIYIACCTRPDVSFAVNRHAQFFSAASEEIYDSALKILAYLGSTMELGLSLGGRRNQDVRAFVDSDFAGDEISRLSTTGNLIFVGDSLISWASKRQKLIATSSTEAEFLAVFYSLRDVQFISQLIISAIPSRFFRLQFSRIIFRRLHSFRMNRQKAGRSILISN
jgi:hypothetical protein